MGQGEIAMTANLQNPIFFDDNKAREWLEARVWPNGPVCPHCGVTAEHVTRLEGQNHRPGLYQCNECREQFTVTVKTVFERSKVPLSKWLAALFMLTASKKGVSAHQIHRSLGITYKTAWFMMHRLREALRGGEFYPFGSEGGEVEADETYIGRVKGSVKRAGQRHKHAVLSLLDRDTKSVRSFHIDEANADEVTPIVRANLAREAHLMTDTGRWFGPVGRELARHETVNHHWEEWVRKVNDPETGEEYSIHVNTLEGYFSLFKRGMKGVYQHCGEKHLHRYLAEFDFRYNNRVAHGVSDHMRAEIAAKGIIGKRLTYRRINGKGAAKAH
jgi:transposase-like protein